MAKPPAEPPEPLPEPKMREEWPPPRELLVGLVCMLALLGALVAICWAVSDTHAPNTTEPDK